MEITKEEISEYPWLQPRSGWYGPSEIPDGWKTLALELCADIKKYLTANEIPYSNYHLDQGKEKWGELHWYDDITGYEGKEYVKIRTDLYNIIDPYIEKSKTTCVCCGEPAKMRMKSWIEPLCDKCFIE